MLCVVAQYEISVAALEMLQSTRDAKGREIQVYKVPLPPNLFITQEEADGLLVSHSLLFKALPVTAQHRALKMTELHPTHQASLLWRA